MGKKNLKINPIFEPLFVDDLNQPRYTLLYGGRGCFLGNQEIVMADGTDKKISEINYGDFVKSYNVETKETENKKVLKTFKYDSEDYIKLKLKNGKEINCTPDHKFLYKDKWMEIQEILKEKFGK